MEKTTIKELRHCRTKKNLHELYLNQMSKRHISNEINDIIRQNRSIPYGAVILCKNITTKEFLLFVKSNGTPDGYVLSEELKLKLNELNDEKN